jgi:hypothetical protein
MGQKNHPLGLRIHSSTRSFDKTWYSDHFFTQLISLDLSLSFYLNTFLKLLYLPLGRFSIQHYPKTTKLYSFFCYPKQSREYKSKMYQIPNTLTFNKSRTSSFSFRNGEHKMDKWQQTQTTSITKLIPWFSSKCILMRPLKMENNNLENPILLYTTNEKWLLSRFSENLLIYKNNHVGILEAHQGVSSGAHSSIFNREEPFYGYKKTFDDKSLEFFNNINTGILDISKRSEIHIKSRNIDLSNKKEMVLKFFSSVLQKDISCFDIIKQVVVNYYITKQKKKPYSLFPQEKRNFLDCKNVKEAQKIEKKNTVSFFKYKNHLQESISQYLKSSFHFIPFKVNQEWQDAGYFADEIVYLLEHRVPFRRLKNKIIKQLALNSNIRGLRLTCAGRVGGKSKKAQRTKKESIKYGQTSLHVFSSKIDFAVRTASTPLGSTGIKIWICYN